MQLFSIKRYEGEDQGVGDARREDEELKKLLKNAARRKRKRKHQEHSESENVAKSATKEVLSENDNSQKNLGVRAREGEVSEVHAAEDTEQAQPGKFQTLGNDVFEKKVECNIVLPPWLRHPTIVVTDINAKDAIENTFSVSQLSKTLMENLSSMNVNTLFPIQTDVIPWILDAHLKPAPFRPRDVCISAPTGSGKTLAYAVPIVEILTKRVECKVRALVVLPVTELILQVYKVFKNLVKNTRLKVGLLSTAVPFTNEQKTLVGKFDQQYYAKADIIVTTPGRLVEHLHNTEGFTLRSLQFLVIDEADRIMEQSHHNWLYHLDEHLKIGTHSFMSSRSATTCLDELERRACKQPHKMLFSATLTQDPEKLESLNLFQPKLFTSIVKTSAEINRELVKAPVDVDDDDRNVNDNSSNFVGKFTTPTELSEYCVLTELRLKPLSLYALIVDQNWKRFLCFTNSAQAASRLAFVLRNLFRSKEAVEELSAIQKPGNRQQILNKLASGKCRGLVCSDALARGIDIENVDVVISYDVPRHIKTYIHRVGRTARAGRSGTAITILTDSDRANFNRILAVAGKDPLPEMTVNAALEEAHAKDYSDVIDALQKSVEQSEHMKVVRKKADKSRAQLNKTDELSIMDRLQEQIVEKLEKTETEIDAGLTVQLRKERRFKAIRKQRKKLEMQQQKLEVPKEKSEKQKNKKRKSDSKQT